MPALLPAVLLIFFSVSLNSPHAFSENGSDWQTVQTLYDTQKYEEALSELKSHPRDHSHYYYNLGTLYYRLNRLGAAIAYLEKAKRLKPNDSDIQHNLSLVRRKLEETRGGKTRAASGEELPIWDSFLFDFRWQTAVGLFGILCISMWLPILRSSPSLRKASTQPLGYLAIGGLLLLSGFFLARWFSSQSPLAITLESQTIRSGPGDQFMELSQTQEGTFLRVQGQEVQSQLEVWRQVRYSQSEVGWVKTSGLLVL